jgi:hypothetical protein
MEKKQLILGGGKRDENTLADLQRFIDLIRDVPKAHVRLVEPMKKTGCREMAPCTGHGGVVIWLNDGNFLTVECGTVAIAAILYYLDPKTADPHFTYWLTDTQKLSIDANRK